MSGAAHVINFNVRSFICNSLMIDDEDMPKLGKTERERSTATLKASLSLIPHIGGALAEIVNHFIPDQRLDRIEEYLRRLETKLTHLSQDEIRKKAEDAETLDLFEEGGFQSARATTEERREQIANVVAYGLSGEDKERIEAKRILKLLRELDDDQIIILAGHLQKNLFDDDFHVRNSDILLGPAVHMQSSRDDLDRATMSDLAKAQLISLGLLRPRFKSVKKGELPQFDPKTGTMKRQSLDISPLGRLVLRRIGIADEDDL